jgi:hypothetical protein
MSLEQCRDGAAGKQSAEGSKLLPGPTIDLGPFLPLSVAPHGQTLLASSVLGACARYIVLEVSGPCVDGRLYTSLCFLNLLVLLFTKGLCLC